MKNKDVTALDRTMAMLCVYCPVCLYARRRQKGSIFNFVKNVEQDLCPFCKAYEKVYGKKAHEKR